MADIPEYIPVSERKKPKKEKPEPLSKPRSKRVRVLSGRRKGLAEIKLAKAAGTHPKPNKKEAKRNG